MLFKTTHSFHHIANKQKTKMNKSKVFSNVVLTLLIFSIFFMVYESVTDTQLFPKAGRVSEIVWPILLLIYAVTEIRKSSKKKAEKENK